MKTKLVYRLLPLFSILFVIAFWWAEALIIGEELLLPSPYETFVKCVELFKEGSFYVALLNTLLRSFLAFVISFAVALTCAVIGKYSKGFSTFISPIISIMRALPTIAVVLLLLIWFGKSIAPLIVTMIVVLPILYTDISETLNGIDKDLTEMCNLYKVSKKERILKVDIPMIAPSLLIDIGTGISLNLKLMVAAEVIASTSKAVGHLMNMASVYNETAELLALMVVVVIIGVLIELLFKTLSKKVGVWK